MGGKKKSKANKLARMSEEEKLRYLQQRAAAEEEARRRKEQLLGAFVKNKLKHEDAFSRLNSAKINQQWRQTLRQIKNNELHEAAETLHQTFNVAIQTKNKIIETLLEDMGISVSLHSLAVQTHLEFINKIIEISEGRLETLDRGYRAAREEKLSDAELQSGRGQQTYTADKKSLSVDIDWQSRYHQLNAARIETLTDDYRNDYKHKVLSETKREEEEGTKKIDVLQGEMKQTLKSYNKTLAPFIKHYKQLERSDINEISERLKNKKMIQEVENKIYKARHIQLLFDNYFKKSNEELRTFYDERKQLFDCLRAKVKNERLQSETATKYLATTSGGVLKNLESVFKKVKTIIEVKKSCKKYLTEKELYITAEYREIADDKYNMVHEDETSFWKSHSDMANEVVTLSAYHGSLIDENTSLNHSLTKYMNTLAKPSNLTSCIYRDTS